MKKILLAAAIQAAIAVTSHAQQIKGTVKDEQGNALSNATVSLLKTSDSTVVKMELSENGAFSFTPATNDSFFIAIVHPDHPAFFSGSFRYTGTTLDLPIYTLSGGKTKLREVTVTAGKTLLEAKPGKTVLHVAGSINATGSDALELVKKSPGITADNDDKLSMNGKNGVQVFIDNKPTPLNGQELAAYLRAIPSSQIESIELIQNPGAMYEASGGAGIINIKLKKNKSMGLNGSVTAGFSGSANGRPEAGATINYRNQKLNVYAGYNGNYGRQQSEFSLNRTIKDTAFAQQNNIVQTKNNHMFKTGLDYTLSSKSNLGIMVNGNFSSPEIVNNNTTHIIYKPSGATDRQMIASNNTQQKNTAINGNINYTFKDTSGRSLVVNADYGYYNNHQDQEQPNTFLDAAGTNESGRKNYRISSPTRIDIYSVKADYEQNLAQGKLSVGLKAGYVETGNDFNQYIQSGNNWQQDKDNSNHFRYREQVNAAYASYAKTVKAFTIQAGLRAEQTNVRGTLSSFENPDAAGKTETQGFSKNYIDVFPSAALSMTQGPKHRLALSYSRRIDRPVYQDLNPFEYRINEYTYHKGSTGLQPQYTNTVSLTHTFMYKLNTTLSYSRVKNVFGQLIDTAHGTKGYLVNRNIASQDIANLNISYPFKYKNYSLFANANAYYSNYRSDYGAGRKLSLDVYAVNFYVMNSYRFAKGWTAELSGFYSSPAIWQGTVKSAAIWSADAGVQKQVLNGNGTIKVSMTDLFKTLKWSGNSNFAGQDVAVAGSSESRQLRINFTYRFGNNNIKAARQYKTGMEDENSRTHGSGGLGH